METAIKIKNLSVVLGKNFNALKQVDLELPVGKIIGFIGPSGAGKTTLIRTLVGSQKITAGQVDVFGQAAGARSLRKEVRYMPQELSVYPDLTVRENLRYFAAMCGLRKSSVNGGVNEVLELVNLTDKANNLVGDLSGGQKQRVSLAVTLLGSPRLLVLDEPTVGLDPVLRLKLWDLFASLAKQGITVIISSHSMDEASRCEDLVLIRDGVILAHDTPHEFLEKTAAKTVEEGFIKLVGSAT